VSGNNCSLVSSDSTLRETFNADFSIPAKFLEHLEKPESSVVLKCGNYGDEKLAHMFMSSTVSAYSSEASNSNRKSTIRFTNFVRFHWDN
jgi:hypothetical protein